MATAPLRKCISVVAGTPVICEVCEGRRFDTSVLEHTFGTRSEHAGAIAGALADEVAS